MKGLSVNITVAVVLNLVTERALLRLAADATEYVLIGLGIETGCDVVKMATDAIQ